MTTLRTADRQLKTLKVGDEFTVKPSHKRYRVIDMAGETEIEVELVNWRYDQLHRFIIMRDTTPVQLIKTIK